MTLSNSWISITLLACLATLSGCAPAMSPATKAILGKDINGLKLALDDGESPGFVIKHKDYKGKSLLQVAVALKDYDAADLLIQRGADITETAEKELYDDRVRRGGGATYLCGDPAELPIGSPLGFLLDRGLDPNVKFDNGMTPLFGTVCDAKETELLLTKGAEINQSWATIDVQIKGNPPSGPRERTPLGFGVETLNSAKQMLKYTNNTGWAAEHVRRVEENTLLLIKSGANPNAKTTSYGGKTRPVLFDAYEIKEWRIVEALLDHGADIMAVSEPDGETLLDLAVKKGSVSDIEKIVAFARSAAEKETRSQEEANRLFYGWLNHAATDSLTPLHRAANKGDAGAVAALVKAGADYSIKDGWGHTAQKSYDMKIERDRIALEEAREADRRKYAQAESDARQSEINKQALLGIAGAAFIGQTSSGKNITDAQRASMSEAWIQDRVNAMNGVVSNNFGRESDAVVEKLNMASMASAAQLKIKIEEQRDAKAQPVAQNAQRDARTNAAKPQPELTTYLPQGNGNGGADDQRSVKPRKTEVEPDPYKSSYDGTGPDRWKPLGSGKGNTREAACIEAESRRSAEIVRLSEHWRLDAISPCVCGVNIGASRSGLDAMAEEGWPDDWRCGTYWKSTQIKEYGAISR